MEPLFPQIPEDLSELSDEDLASTIEQCESVSESIRVAASADATEEQRAILEGRDPVAVLDEMTSAADAVLAMRAVASARDEAAANFTNAVAEQAARMATPADDDAEPEPSDPDPEDPEAAVETPEATPEEVADVVAEAETATAEAAEVAPAAAVAAAAAEPERRLPVRLPAPPRASRSRQPVFVNESAEAVIVASGTDRMFKKGEHLTSDQVAEAMKLEMRNLGSIRDQKAYVASVHYPFPEDRQLKKGDLDGNTAKIRAIGNPFLGVEAQEALVASGGLCAPLEPIYAIPSFSTAARPVRDSFPSFQAERGGVTVPTPPTVADFVDAITVIEESDDALGGTFATKSCLAATCPAFTDVAVGIISHCRSDGNLNARAWPEYIAFANAETMAEHSRIADGRLLDRYDALALNVTAAAVYGASATLLWALQLARVHIISTLRMRPDSRIRVILPFWGAAMFSQDLVNSQFGRFETPPEQVAALLARYGIDVTWHLDQGVAGGATTEVFPAEVTGGALDDWLGTTMIARAYAEGALLHVDSGTLELGVVRDSTLNETNDFQTFGETFENLARVGPAQSVYRIAITICPSGTTGPTATAITCS